jgi:hypothetical protein
LIRTSLGKEGGGEALAKTNMGEKFRILRGYNCHSKAFRKTKSAKEEGPVERDPWQSKFLYAWRSQFVEMIEIRRDPRSKTELYLGTSVIGGASIIHMTVSITVFVVVILLSVIVATGDCG